MRKLSESERMHLRKILEAKTAVVVKVMTIFRIFGSLQILALILYMIFGSAKPSDRPFMLVGCVILYMAYFKLTELVANQNQWKGLLQMINKNKEIVYDCELINTYETSHGETHGAKEFMANVKMGNGKVVRCNAEHALKEQEPGTKVALVCTYSGVELGFKFAIGSQM